MKISVKKKKFILETSLIIIFSLLVLFIWYTGYRQKKAALIELQSRYTFSVCIDTYGNVVKSIPDVDENKDVTNGSSDKICEFGNLEITTIGDIWLREFTNQFKQNYIPYSKSLGKVKINKIEKLSDDNTVLLSFSVVVRDSTSEYFSSWNGVTSSGKLNCEWVMTYDIADNYDGTATVSVRQIMSPEEYGLSQYGLNGNAQTETDKNELKNEMNNYLIRDNNLSVTFDGGSKYVTVPIDCKYLPYKENSKSELKEGSYYIEGEKTVFIYGGIEEEKIPLTILYTEDKGATWIACDIDKLYNIDYYYIKFFNNKVGTIVIGYQRDNNQELSRMYNTIDGGETWADNGSGPAMNIIKGVEFIDSNVGFFCYEYSTGMESNLYETRDGGKSFSKVIFEKQELDSSAKISTSGDNTIKLTWSDVYKDALVPVVNAEGKISVYLSQGANGIYNGGKIAALYQSEDQGLTWKYVGEYELK